MIIESAYDIINNLPTYVPIATEEAVSELFVLTYVALAVHTRSPESTR